MSNLVHVVLPHSRRPSCFCWRGKKKKGNNQSRWTEKSRFHSRPKKDDSGNFRYYYGTLGHIQYASTELKDMTKMNMSKVEEGESCTSWRKFCPEEVLMVKDEKMCKEKRVLDSVGSHHIWSKEDFLSHEVCEDIYIIKPNDEKIKVKGSGEVKTKFRVKTLRKSRHVPRHEIYIISFGEVRRVGLE